MSEETEVDYGPLAGLIGVWQGAKGMDIAPEPDGTEENPYYETITFEAGGDLKNAEDQVVAGVRYHQVVKRKSDDGIFHDEVGYWMWDAREKTIMHSLAIPRAVCVLAGGTYNGEKDNDGNVILEVSAGVNNEDWGIVQSPYMQKKAKTTDFKHKIVVGGDKLTYSETTMLDIYGKVFEHTDDNILTRQ